MGLHLESIIQTNQGPCFLKNLNPLFHKIFIFKNPSKELRLSSDFKIQTENSFDMYTLETKLGNIDRATEKQHYYIYKKNGFEWVKAKNLKVGDRIAIPKNYDSTFPIKSAERSKFKLLGYLISDGGTNYKDQARFTNFNPVTIKDLNNLLKKDFNSKLSRHNKGHYGLVMKDKTLHSKVYIKEFTYKYNLQHKAIKKRIPFDVFSTSIGNSSEFISAAWDCDGWVDKLAIGYCSSSFLLANGMKHLLRKIGIQSKLRKKYIKFGGKIFTTYQVEVRGINNLFKFQDKVKLLSKKDKLDKFISGRSRGINSYEMMPIEVNYYIRKLSKDMNINLRKKGVRVKINERVSLMKVERVNLYLNDRYLNQLLNMNIVIDEIKNIELSKHEPSIKIILPKNYGFISDDIFTK